MNSSISRVKGFRNDKRNLLEGSTNLVVFGHQQLPSDQRLMRRIGDPNGNITLGRGGKTRLRTKISNPTPYLVPEPGRVLHKLLEKDGLTVNNGFTKTKPWRTKTNFSSSESSEPTISTVDTNQLTTPNEVKEIPRTSLHAKIAEIATAVPPPSKGEKTNKTKEPDPTLLLAPPDEVEKKGRNTIYCPVCMKGLEPRTLSRHTPATDVMKVSFQAYESAGSGAFRKSLEDGWGPTIKNKRTVEPQNVVVAANCGQLFHKMCLRDWCCRNHLQNGKSPRSPKCSPKGLCLCPSCGKELKYTTCQEIDAYTSFTSEITELEKELNKVKLINKELHLMWPETNNYLSKLKREIDDNKTLYSEIRSKRREVKAELKKLTAEDLSVVMAKVTDVNSLRSSLGKQAKALEFMQQETLQIMRIYLLTVMRKLKVTNADSSTDCNAPQGDVELNSKIPTALVPHLQKILNDDEALSLLARLIMPKINEALNLPSQMLLELEILRRYEPSTEQKLPRTTTYTVISTPGEGGDTEAEEEPVEKKSESDITPKLTGPLKNISSLKLSLATHKLPAVIYTTKISALQPSPVSNLSVVEKPPHLLKVVEIAESGLRITSSANISEDMDSTSRKASEAGGLMFESTCGRSQLLPRSSLNVSATSTITPSEVAQRYPSSEQKLEVISDHLPNISQLKDSSTGEVDGAQDDHQSTLAQNSSLIRDLPQGRNSLRTVCSAPQQKISEVRLLTSREQKSWCTISSDDDRQRNGNVAMPLVMEPESVDSCKMVYSAEKKSNTEAFQQLSITIMYMVESEEEANGANQQQQGNIKVSNEETQDQERVLSPIYIRADKTSKCSVLGKDSSRNSSATETTFNGDLNGTVSESECADESPDEAVNDLEVQELRCMQSLPLPPLPYDNGWTMKKGAYESLPTFQRDNILRETSTVSVFYENEKAIRKVSTSSAIERMSMPTN